MVTTLASAIYRLRYLTPLLLTIIVVTTSLGWALLFDIQPRSDALTYHRHAIDISQGRGYDPDAYWPVGYPLALGIAYSIFGPNLVVARILNAFAYAAMTLSSYYLASAWFKSKEVSALTALSLVLYPGFAIFINITMSEVLFSSLILMGLALLQSSQNRKSKALTVMISFGAGILFGIATLVRPQAVLLPILCVLVLEKLLLFSNFKGTLFVLVKVAAIYLGIAILVLPWLLHLAAQFDQFVFISTNGGINLFMGNNPQADGSYMEDTVSQVLEGLGYEMNPGLNAAQRDSVYQAAAIHYIINYPTESILRIVNKAFYYFRDEVSGWLLMQDSIVKFVGMFTSQVMYLAVGAMALYGIVKARSSVPAITYQLAITVTGYFLVIALVFFGASRFRLPSIPIIVMFATYGLLTFIGKKSQNVERSHQ